MFSFSRIVARKKFAAIKVRTKTPRMKSVYVPLRNPAKEGELSTVLGFG